MTWRKDEDADAPFKFSVVRSADKKRLEMKPGLRGGFDIIVDDIVTTSCDTLYSDDPTGTNAARCRLAVNCR
jgi:hypothetical protein